MCLPASRLFSPHFVVSVKNEDLTPILLRGKKLIDKNQSLWDLLRISYSTLNDLQEEKC